MATTDQASASTGGATQRWYALAADDAVEQLGVDPAKGLSAAKAAELLQKNGPNELPAEKPTPEWRRFLGQYRSYMQILLLIAGVASLAIGQWSTGAVLILLTVFNAIVGLRQAGKAESAMNALRSMTKQTARVRRDGVEAALPALQAVKVELEAEAPKGAAPDPFEAEADGADDRPKGKKARKKAKKAAK